MDLKKLKKGTTTNQQQTLTLSGDVYTWGWNSYGQLGRGDVGQHTAKPGIAVGLKKKFAVVYATFNFGAALTSTPMHPAGHTNRPTGGGEIATWGQGKYGQLGTGETPEYCAVPKKITSLKKGASMAATGNTHCLLVKGRSGSLLRRNVHKGGTVYSWGQGLHGKLGHGDEKDYPTPTPIAALKGKKVTSISCGAEHSACVADGSVYTWGYGDSGSKEQVANVLI